jgi:hypothetical protein
VRGGAIAAQLIKDRMDDEKPEELTPAQIAKLMEVATPARCARLERLGYEFAA